MYVVFNVAFEIVFTLASLKKTYLPLESQNLDEEPRYLRKGRACHKLAALGEEAAKLAALMAVHLTG